MATTKPAITVTQAVKNLIHEAGPLLRQLPSTSHLPQRLMEFADVLERDITALQQEVASLRAAAAQKR